MIVLTCDDKIHNGVWRHLNELANLVDFAKYIPTKTLLKSSFNDIKLVIMGGCWNSDYEIINKFANTKGIKTAILFCSPLGQATINNELNHLNNLLSLLSSGKLSYLFLGHEYLADEIKDKNIIWLPQPFNIEKFNEKIKKIKREVVPNSVGLFNSSGKHKNLLNQALAVKQLGKKLLINGLNNDSVLIHLLNKFNINYELYDWLNESEYFKLISSCEIGLQCSFSESFDYVAAEMSLMGVPVVTSPAVYWNIDELMAPLPDNPSNIAFHIKNAYKINKKRIISNITNEIKRRNDIARITMKEVYNES